MGADNYYVLRGNGKKDGPFDVHSLKLWAQDGRLRPNMSLESVATGEVISANTMDDLFVRPTKHEYQTSMPQIDARINNYLLGAVLISLFCCMPIGAVAIAYSVAAEMASRRRDFNEAKHAADQALKWILISFALGAAAYFIGIVWYATHKPAF